MSAYYYLMASLSSLEFDGKPPLSLDGYLRLCSEHLTGGDCALLNDVLSLEPTPRTRANALAAAWIKFERDFRNEMAWQRSQWAGKDPAVHVRGERHADAPLIEVIQQAAKAADLLTAEKILDRKRWQILEDLLLGHYFDTEAILIYGLKLKILERYQNILSPKGRAIFTELKRVKIPEGSGS